MSDNTEAGRVSIPLERELGVVIKWKNARAVIKQLRNNEWAFNFNEIENDYLTAKRNERRLWLGNGAFFCDVDDANAFGYLFRHYVWWSAAYWKLREVRKKLGFTQIPRLYKD